MKKLVLMGCVLACALLAGGGVAVAQSVKSGPDASINRDPVLEAESKHNLEVARHYFKLKKAYRAAIARCEEIIAGHPTFSRLDEVLYIAGESSRLLAQHKGKQAPTLPPEKLRDDARTYLTRLVEEFPESPFRERAEAELRALGGPKPKAEQQK